MRGIIAGGRRAFSCCVGEGLAPSREGGKVPLSPSHRPPHTGGGKPLPYFKINAYGAAPGRGPPETRRDAIYRITTKLALHLGGMPRELTDADYERLLDLRNGLRRFMRWSDEQAAAAGLTSAQHQLLLAVRGHHNAEAPGLGPTIGDVAGYLLLRHHSAVGLVDRAVRAGLVVRQEDPTDRRVVRLVLTPLGHDLLTLLTSAHFEELERLVPRMRELWP